MSRPLPYLAIAVALSIVAPVQAQDGGIGLRRLSPPTPAAPAPRRAPAPRPAAPALPPIGAEPAQVAVPPAPPVGATPNATPRSPPVSPAAAFGERPVIIIDSRRIGDPGGPVNEVARANRQVVQEFAPRTDALIKLRAEAEQTQAAADAAKGRDKNALAAKARLQRAEFDTRNTALEKEFKARSETLLAPVQTRINEALKAFAIANNATIVLDGARFNSAVLAMKAGVDPASLDLTAAFVDSYNRTHP